MSAALESILEVLKQEAETQVRTEYENTVVALRARVAELEKAVALANSEWDKWRDYANKRDQDYDELVKRVRDALK